MNSIAVNIPSITDVSISNVSGKRVAFSTLGCKVNSFETELIAQKITNLHYQRVGFAESADLYIINTCTVTAEADRQARQQVRRAIRQNSDAFVVVTGCYAQMDSAACAQIPGVDLVVGNSQKLDIPDLLESLFEGDLPPIMLRDIDKEISLPEELLQGYEGKSRAFVQIQQGCDQGCTFCIIHTARGPNRSFSREMIMRQCERLILNGYAEIVLCGVDVGSYGSDIAGQNLCSLLRDLIKLEGDFRIRLSSIDPIHITDELIDIMKTSSVICPQLHLSLQSVNTLILKRMKRRASREIIYDRIARLREAVPELILSADILVGFPTETDEQFRDTLTGIEDLEIAFPHVFAYSPRPGTPAARIPKQVPVTIRKQRASLAREAGKSIWNKVASRQIGRTLRLLVESNSKATDEYIANRPQKAIGRAANYFPVEFMAEEKGNMKWANVRINEVQDGKLKGSLNHSDSDKY